MDRYHTDDDNAILLTDHYDYLLEKLGDDYSPVTMNQDSIVITKLSFLVN